MSQVPLWFERKFDFTFPVEQYPRVRVRLRRTPARLEEMLHGVSREVLIAKPGDNWSAQQHVGHLLDLKSLWMARVEDFLSGGELAQILAAFRAARLCLVDRVWGFQPDLFARSMRHPRLKQPMRLVDHLYPVTEHDDHHWASIWEMING